MKKTKIVSAFPCCGKTYASIKYIDELDIADSDSSKFSWILDEDGNPTPERNPDFPNNYIEHIKSLIGEVDIIFVSSHSQVRDALKQNDIHFSTIIPDRNTCKAEWIGRAYLRGSSIEFLNTLADNWDVWLDSIQASYNYPVMVLNRGQYLDVDFILHSGGPYVPATE